MKNIIGIIALLSLVSFYGCSSDSVCDDSQAGDDFDLYGVAKWDNPEDFTIRHYYTLVDTITLKRPNISVVIKATDNLEASVDWTIGNGKYESIYVDGIYNNAQGIGIRTFYPFLPDGFEYTDRMSVSADAKIGGNTVRRNGQIKEESMERDVLCVDFGMDVSEVEYEIESLRGEGKFVLRSDGIGCENIAPHFAGQGMTLYIFDDEGSLAEVAEFPATIFRTDEEGEITDSVSESFLAFCRRVGLTEEIGLTDEGKMLVKDYEWEREGILFTLHARDDVFPLDGEDLEDDEESYVPHSIGISYRPV